VTKRISQILISLAACVSIFASPLVACACDHHKTPEKAEASCHPKPAADHHQKSTASHQPSAEQTETVSNGASNNDDCVCVQPVAKAFAKSETVKVKKHSGAISVLPEVEERSDAAIVESIENHDEPDGLLLRGALRTKPSRGPPAL
jgi:hypothetical protein